MARETVRLAEYAAGLRYQDLPRDVVQRRHSPSRRNKASMGRDLVTAVVAGFEMMYRIGRVTKHSNERHGFHAPGTTGRFGAAVAAGKL